MSIKYNGKIIAGNYKITESTTASDAVAGFIKIATDEELSDYTNNNVAITPYLLNKALNGINRGLKIGRIGIGFINESQQQERYLNGQVIIQDQFESFTTWVKELVALYPNLSCTNEEYETTCTLSAFGQCGKFVVDDNAGSIRLPKVVNVQGLFDLTQAGLTVEAGLPAHTHTRGTMNITGSFFIGKAGQTGNGYGATGAFYYKGNANNSGNSAQTGGVTPEFAFDASRSWTGSTSNPNYTNDIKTTATVQQEAVQYPYWIQVATGVDESVDVTREIELNIPYSLLDVKWSDKLLNNVSWLRSQGQANSKAVYNDVYELILKEYNSGTDETETVGGVTITYRRGTDTNIKVTTDKSAYDSILSATGTAWYYVIDTANETFYLPQSDGFFQFGGDGNFVEAGLPNIEGKFSAGVNNGYARDGVLFTSINYGDNSQGVSGNYSSGVSFNASRYNSIYGNSTTVQPNAVKGYLYFYVGETVQNANLINVGRIEEKVASLIPDNSSLISGYTMPSGRYIDLTLGASGSTYTAPANGWFQFTKKASGAVQSVSLWNSTIASFGIRTSVPSGENAACFLPTRKGDICTVAYGASGETITFRFYYAQGEQ